jgi:hypothetical protein
VIRRLLTDSIATRAVAAIGFVLAGYVLLHGRFAAFDAGLAGHALGLLGFHVSSAGAGDLTVSAGRQFNVYAVVTGSCSSAAGVLGLLAVSLLLLPGPWARRWAGGLAAAALFMAFNVARICSIVLLGWWMASAGRGLVLGTLLGAAAVCTVAVIVPHRHLILRLVALLCGGLCLVLAYDVHNGNDYLEGMASYHALAGPILTVSTLALGILVIWRALAGPDRPGDHVAPAGTA